MQVVTMLRLSSLSLRERHGCLNDLNWSGSISAHRIRLDNVAFVH